ncbi:hypothetical protein P4603_26210 [Priestia aryabhattai]|uniref:type IV secretion system protein n=1 Tax=Priestia aryabhattai TaxID=412384 RepID=UPI002E1F35B9|nr:type IV secretion system protein [Priestia aryabhattai]MED3955568.1 hypothetical protein [Priestia aryabhattai]
MGKRFGIMLLILFFLCSIPVVVNADAALAGMAKKKPSKDPNSLTEDEKKEASQLKKDLQDLYEEYFKKVVTYSEKKLNEKYVEEDKNFVREGLVKGVVDKGHENFEAEFYGSPSIFEDGSFGKLSEKLWKKYGILTEFQRDKKGLFDSCTTKSYTIWGDGLCEGHPSFTYSYENKKLTYTVPKLQFINGKNTEEKKKSEYPTLIASEGLFTKPETLKEEKCNIEDVSKKFGENKHIGEPDLGGGKEGDSLSKMSVIEFYSDKVGREMQQTFRSLIGSLDKHFFGTNCDQNSVSVLGQLTNISKPFNLTDNRLIMSVSHIMTQISFSFTIILIAFFALMFTTGYQNLNPIKFGITLFFCLLTINYLPYIVQDVLNLNNKIVHELSSIQLNLEPLKDDDGNPIETIGGQPVDLLSGSLNGMFSTLLEKTNNTDELLLLILLLVIMFFSLIPLLRLIMWWYFRMIKISLMVCVGPFMILTLCLPPTSSYGKRWISNLVGEVLSQVFVSIGLLMISVFISNIGEVAYTGHLAWFGIFLFLLACIFSLAELPQFAKSLVDGVVNMGESHAASTGHRIGRSGQMRANDISRGIVKGLGGKKTGNSLPAKAANKLSRAVPMGGGNLVRGMQGKSRSQNPGLSGRVGHSIGGGLNKVGTKTGGIMQRISDKTGSKISVGSSAGKSFAAGAGAGIIASKSMQMSTSNKRLKMSNDVEQNGTGAGINRKVSELNKKSEAFASANNLSNTMSQAAGTMNNMKNKRSSLFGNTSEPKKEHEKTSNSSAESTKPVSEVQQRINKNREQEKIRDMKRKKQAESKQKMSGNSGIKNKEASGSQIPPIVFGEQFKTPEQRPNNNNVTPNKTNNKAPNKQSSATKKTTPTKKVDKPKEPPKSNGTLPTLPQFQSPVQQPTSSKKTTDKSTEKPNKPSEIKKKD